MKTLRLLIRRGVALPGGVNAFPGSVHEVEERFARGLLFDGRAIAAGDVIAADEREDAPQDAPSTVQDRDPAPATRDPVRRPRHNR